MAFIDSVYWQIVLAFMVLLAGFILARLLSLFVSWFLRRFEIDAYLENAGYPIALEETVSVFIKYVIFVVALYFSLSVLSIAEYVLAIVAGFGIIILLLSILLGLKDFVPNYWAGFWLKRKNFYKKGDKISVNDVSGTVEFFSVLETGIKTQSGDIVFIPSSLMLQSQVVKRK